MRVNLFPQTRNFCSSDRCVWGSFVVVVVVCGSTDVLLFSLLLYPHLPPSHILWIIGLFFFFSLNTAVMYEESQLSNVTYYLSLHSSLAEQIWDSCASDDYSIIDQITNEVKSMYVKSFKNI